MKYGLKIAGQNFQFSETVSGLLDLESGGDLSPETSQLFQFDEIGRQAILEMQGIPSTLVSRAFHYRFLVKAARIVSFYQAGVTFKSAIWINYDFINDTGYLTLLRAMLGSQSCNELFFEFALGVYGNPDISKTNTARLIGGAPVDLDMAARQWFNQVDSFSTRIVGFSYRKDRFIRPGIDMDTLTLAVDDPVFVVREPQNTHDSNAISLLWKNGEKLSVVRLGNCMLTRIARRGDLISIT